MLKKISLITIMALLVLGWITLANAEETKYYYDPVCYMTVKADTPHFMDFEGKTYYFCSQVCKTQFTGDPAKFACYCLSGSDCMHCTGKTAYCSCEKSRHGHEHCHGKHRGY